VGKLPRSFYAREAPVVARELLGKVVVLDLTNAKAARAEDPDALARARPEPTTPANATRLRARIVETEAYGGPEDLASHARFGPTKRNSSMFGPPGRLYVYFVYGVHHCMNVVTGRDGQGQAVLLRAAEPLDGWEADLSGPGRLARAFRLTRQHDGMDLLNGPLTIHADGAEVRVVATTRVGVDFAGKWAHEPLRFLDADSRHVSRRPKPRPA
jgi:DNA-3-methyladenine glycosylase